MGYPMAGNIRKKISPNATLIVNKSSQSERFVEEFGNFGLIKIVGSPKEVATEATIVVSIVPAGKEVAQVYLDSQTGIIQAPENPDRILLECSTIDIKTAKEVSAKMSEARRGTYFDSPVSVSMSKTLHRNLLNRIYLLKLTRAVLLGLPLEPWHL
jgi:3-hydroxyisobutyrate dehydrogenase-like beta-hydroxyacid dehydrogenase